MDLRRILSAQAVLPVVVIDDDARALPLARALLAGGITAIEITLRTPAALDCIGAVARALPEIAVGAGTVLEPGDLDAARAAGARFAVSPGTTPELLRAAAASDLPFLPGVATASEAMAAAAFGYETLKFFPAVPSGGVAALRALAGPLPRLAFAPTGGITAANAPEFLALPNVVCVGGTWLAPPELIAAGDWDGITALARQAVALRRWT